MKKILKPLFAILLFSACNNQNNEALTKRIENLKKDSTEYAQLKAKIDSLTTIDSLNKKAAYEDSLKSKQNLCEIGECCVKIASNLKSYANNKVSYIQMNNYMVKLELLLQKVTIPDKLREELIQFISTYSQGVAQAPYMHSSVNAQMSSELWLEIYHAKAKNLKNKFCTL